MWTEVAKQMGIPGGLGEKMEDWVELMHQWGNRRRIRFRTTVNIQVRANARAKSTHRGTDPNVIAHQDFVASEAARDLKDKGQKTYVGEARRAERENRREAALDAFENGRSASMRLCRWLGTLKC